MTTQLATDSPPIAPFRSTPEIWWMGFIYCTTFDEARRIFELKHGHPPREQRPSGPILLVGPIEGG